MFFGTVSAEPWINTSDMQMRSDVETLADIGIIKVPVTSYPLMWAGIIKDVDSTNIQDVPSEYKNVFWRVKKAGKVAVSTRQKKLLRFAASNSEQVLRSFGDSSRHRMELTANRAGMNKSFAWNVQINRALDPMDNDRVYFDGSYIAAVWENWVISIGSVEKWWGASWDSANLISNNARTPFGITFTRNYSDASNLPVLNWLGKWNITGFIARLDDDRVINEPNFSGLSFSFKPVDSLEFSYRATAISGGISEPNLENIEQENIEQPNIDNKIINGVDFRWNLPRVVTSESFPTSLYVSATDDDQHSNFSSLQYGLTSRIKVFSHDWRIFLESSQTKPNNLNVDSFNSTYEDEFYRTGYRYNRRAIGSTFDNDSKVVSFGIMGNLSSHQSFVLKLQNLSINQRGNANERDLNHTISSTDKRLKRISGHWKYQIDRHNQIEVKMDYTDKIFDEFERQKDKLSIGFEWSYLF